jgi:hypothetical protein
MRRRHVRLWQILLQKSFCEVGLKFSDPLVQRLDSDAGGPTSPSAKLPGDSRSVFETPLIGDCRLFRSSAGN